MGGTPARTSRPRSYRVRGDRARSDHIIVATGGSGTATGYTLTGPLSGSVGVASTNFTVTLTPAGSQVVSPVTVFPATTGGGTFTPSSVTFTPSALAAYGDSTFGVGTYGTTPTASVTFIYTPSSSGSKVITVTNSGGLVDPPSVTYSAVSSGFTGLTATTLTDVTWGGVTGVGTLDPTRVNTTMMSIGVELRYTGDPDLNSSVTLEYKRNVDSTWRMALPMWRSIGTSSDTYHSGSALLCTPGTLYNVRLTITDGAETAQVTVNATTRAEIDTNAAVTPNRWLDAVNGSDSNSGTTAGTPVRTWRKAVTLANAATSDQVWSIASGNYVGSSNLIVKCTTAGVKLTFKAANPAVTVNTVVQGGESRQVAQASATAGSGGTYGTSTYGSGTYGPAAAGQPHAILQPRAADGGPLMWAPTGAADADIQIGAATDVGTITTNRIAPWVLTSIMGTNGVTYSTQIYKWASCPAQASTTPLKITTSSTRTGACQSVCCWRAIASGSWNVSGSEPAYTWRDITTVGGWAAEMMAGSLYRFGSYNDNVSNDLYVRLPGDVDPNTVYGWVTPEQHFSLPSGQLVYAGGPDQRYSGLEFRGSAIGIATFTTNPSDRLIVDHCWFNCNLIGTYDTGTAGPPSVYCVDALLDSNVYYNNLTYNLSPVGSTIDDRPYPLPWRFTKATIGKGNSGVGTAGNGTSRRKTVRFCTFDGTFDGTSSNDSGFDRYAGSDMDIHDCYFVNLGDDPHDLSFHKNNIRIWNNRQEYCRTVMSYAPETSGVIYVWNNVAWRHGMIGAFADWIGTTTSGTGLMLKMEGLTPVSKLYWLNNTVWSDAIADLRGHVSPAYMWSMAGGGSPVDSARITFRNNITRCQGGASSQIIGAIQNPASSNGYFLWDSDYNDWSAVPGSAGGNSNSYIANSPGTDPGNSTVAYRANCAAFGVGSHDCLRATAFSTVSDPELVAPTSGNLHLIATSVLQSAGVAIYPYEAAVPDIGYAPLT